MITLDPFLWVLKLNLHLKMQVGEMIHFKIKYANKKCYCEKLEHRSDKF